MKLFSYRYGSHYDPDTNEMLLLAETVEAKSSVSISVNLDDDSLSSLFCMIDQLQQLFLEQMLNVGVQYPEARKRIVDAILSNLDDAVDTAEVQAALQRLRDTHPSRKKGTS